MNSTDSYQQNLKNEAKLHAITRLENDTCLASQHDVIRNAANIEILEPFAKAYLGLFLEIDSTFPPEQRIRFIASDNLANAVMQGLTVALDSTKGLASPKEIGQAMAADQRLEIGYVLLVSMDLITQQSTNLEKIFQQIDSTVLSATLCFHYANSSSFHNSWVETLIESEPALVTETLQQFWFPQMDKGVRYLPGLRELLKTQQGKQLVGDIILPVLSGWSGYKKRSLNVLLAIALRYADSKKLLPIIEDILEKNQTLNPRMRMVWLTSAFILAPDRYWQTMQDYTYRSKEKLLPLLDFTVALLDEISLELDALTKIIRLIAPKFPPHIDDFGKLAANPQKTLRLFYELANRKEPIVKQVAWLRTARVMKIVSPVLDSVERLNKDKQTFPSFTQYIEDLLLSGSLKEKRSRFKNKL